MRESSTVPVCGSTAVTVNFFPSTSSLSASFRPSLAATSAPRRASLYSSVSMTFLRESVFLSSDPIIPTEAPQPTGREKIPAPLQAAFA